jgi:RsiW-degrading membrane proteinase PrsW (M82 family)
MKSLKHIIIEFIIVLGSGLLWEVTTSISETIGVPWKSLLVGLVVAMPFYFGIYKLIDYYGRKYHEWKEYER